MRNFDVDAIKKMMGRFNIPEDEPIENKLITNSLEKAQEKIEGFNFDARKHVLEFDDVLNFQRNIIYSKRREVLMGGVEEIKSYLNEASEELEPEIKDKTVEKIAKLNFEITEVPEVLRRIILQTIDMFWVDHLEMMEYLRGSVNLRAYGQRDPLVEYKKDGLRFFRDMEASIARQIAEFIMALDLKALASADADRKNALSPPGGDVRSTPPVGVRDVFSVQHLPSEKIGRNDPCPCQSGKKWKHCGLKNTEEHERLMAGK